MTTPIAVDWTPGAVKAIEWFLTTEPPSEPFQLQPGVTIMNPALYWTSLQMDIKQGPGGPRAGAVIYDIDKLRKNRKLKL